MKRFFRKYQILLLSLLALVALVGSTYAYLIATDGQIINVFKLAKIDTSIEEKTEGYGTKEVTIKNNQVSPVYVRARVVISGADVNVPDAGADAYVTSEADAPTDSISVLYNSTDWEKVGDWFYYKHILPGMTEASDGNPAVYPKTEPLIYKVLVGSNVQLPENPEFSVDVYQESVLTSATSFNLTDAQAAFN